MKLSGATLEKVAGLLDLPADASIADVIARLRELFPEGADAPAKPAPSDDALGGTAAPAKKLSAKEEAYCAKHNLTPAQFAARKRAAVRTEGASAPTSTPAKRLSAREEAFCRKHNLTREQFEARKAESVRKGSR